MVGSGISLHHTRLQTWAGPDDPNSFRVMCFVKLLNKVLSTVVQNSQEIMSTLPAYQVTVKRNCLGKTQ